MRAKDVLHPIQVRAHCRLSPITLDELGRVRPSLSAELTNAQTIFNNHEAEQWAALNEDDYDTIFPELSAYIHELRDILNQ